MSFLYPYVLCALLLPLLLAAAVFLVMRHSGRAWRQLVSPAHFGSLVTRRAPWRTVVPALFCLLALACAITALARPIHGYREAGATATGRNLLLALDISRSMETQDVKPSRLEEARAAAYELIEALPNDKIGLIVFSGTSDLVVPLTYDHTALRDALEQVNRGWAGAGGTNFGLVLQKAMQDFKRSAPDGTNALVILSDGEDTVDTKRDIEAEAKENHLMVITVGIGTAAGGPIPDPRGENGLWQDADGKHVISKLDAESLQAFAKATGGSYFQMGPNADLAAFARRTVSKLDAHEEEYSVNKVPNDLFAYFAAAALLLAMAGILAATDWRAPRRLNVLLLLLLLPGMQAWGASAESVAAYREGLLQMQEDPGKARESFSRALLDADRGMQAAALYEMGNLGTKATFGELRALYGDAAEQQEEGLAEQPQQQQVTPEALQQIVDKLKQNKTPYQDALKADPAQKESKANLAKIEELIKKLEEEIERLKQQQQQENNQQDSQNQDDNRNEDNKDGGNDDNQQQNQDNQDDRDNKGQDDREQNKGNDDKDDSRTDQDKQNDGDNKQDDSQDKQDGDDKQDDNRSQGQQPQPQEQQEGEDDRQQQNPQQQQEQQQQAEQAPQPELSDKEKARRRAASILQMHVDEEHGSPIPHFNDTVRPPKKDY